MHTTPATGDTTVRSVDEQFLELICSDADLLAAEFDAIIAAEWSTPPADREARGTADGHSGSGPARATDPGRDLVGRPRHPGVGGWARQRSPPPRQPTPSEKKGR
jgi:hypothetical protein